MFFERGYEATTTQDIGAALGLLKGSIYYYISSKQGLLVELVQQYHEDTRGYFEVILASDALAGHAHGLHEATLATFYRIFGDVRPGDDIIALLRCSVRL